MIPPLPPATAAAAYAPAQVTPPAQSFLPYPTRSFELLNSINDSKIQVNCQSAVGGHTPLLPARPQRIYHLHTYHDKCCSPQKKRQNEEAEKEEEDIAKEKKNKNR